MRKDGIAGLAKVALGEKELEMDNCLLLVPQIEEIVDTVTLSLGLTEKETEMV